MSYVASQTPFATVVPEQLVWADKGTFWTVIKQRGFRWNVTNFRHIWMDVWLFFTYVPRKSTLFRTIMGTLVFRLFLISELLSVYLTLSMPVALYFLLKFYWKWWLIVHASLYGSSVLQGFLTNYFIMRKRPDLRVEWYIFFIMPLYRYLLRWVRVIGVLATILVYIPLYPHPARVDQRPKVK